MSPSEPVADGLQEESSRAPIPASPLSDLQMPAAGDGFETMVLTPIEGSSSSVVPMEAANAMSSSPPDSQILAVETRMVRRQPAEDSQEVVQEAVQLTMMGANNSVTNHISGLQAAAAFQHQAAE